MALFRVALTGGIAEGKTTVLRMLAEFGMRTASSDDVAREVFDEPETRAEIGQKLNLVGRIDRESLAAVIASDPSKRRALNEVMHPEILSRLVSLDADVVEVPLLVETCLQSMFGRVWVVTCGGQEQQRRLAERLGDPVLARSLIAAQLPTEVKCAFADRIVRTDRPFASVIQEAEELARFVVSQ